MTLPAAAHTLRSPSPETPSAFQGRQKSCPCCQSRRKEGCLPPRDSICHSRGLWGKVSSRELNCCQNSGGEGEGVRYADKPSGLSAHARTAVFAIGRAKTVTEHGVYPCETNQTQSLWRTLGFPELTRSISFRSYSQKRFALQRFFAKRRNERFQRTVRLCRTAAWSAPFRRRQFEKKRVNPYILSL